MRPKVRIIDGGETGMVVGQTAVSVEVELPGRGVFVFMAEEVELI